MKNIAGYKFIELTEVEDLQTLLLQQCQSIDLKGTILLSSEGINITLAGTEENVAAFQAYLKADPRFEDITFRESHSKMQPFKFMRVKLKKEIITMGKPEIRPEVSRAPAISPQDLKQWLDENKDFTLLDTRNDYEVRFGTFRGAEHFQLKDFGEFPERATDLENIKPIVMFCTGGIRCEKAGLALLNQGYQEVYQLEGGILNYFSEVGGDHYDGECFVFDQRISVDTDLQETGTIQCITCQGPVKTGQTACCIAS